MQSTTDLLDRRAAPSLGTSYLAEVVSVADPKHRARVRVRLYAYDGVDDQNAPIWARVAVPFAGGNRGAFLVPDKGDEVLVTFVNGDPRLPVVIGGLWNGGAQPAERLGGAGERVDRWTFTGKAGTRIAMVEERAGEETISLTTPGGVRVELTDTGGGKIELEAGGTRITLDAGGVEIETGGKIENKASQFDVKSGQVKVDTAQWSYTGVGTCDVVRATTVMGSTYMPGAGNVW